MHKQREKANQEKLRLQEDISSKKKDLSEIVEMYKELIEKYDIEDDEFKIEYMKKEDPNQETIS